MLSTEINKRFKFFYRSFTESNSALNRCRFRCVDMGDAFFALSTKRKHKRIDYWRSRIQKFSTYFDYELFFMWTNQSFLFWKKKQKKKNPKKNRSESPCYRRTHLNIKWMCGKLCARFVRWWTVCEWQNSTFVNHPNFVQSFFYSSIELLLTFSSEHMRCCRPRIRNWWFFNEIILKKKISIWFAIEFQLNSHLTIPNTYWP